MTTNHTWGGTVKLQKFLLGVGVSYPPPFHLTLPLSIIALKETCPQPTLSAVDGGFPFLCHSEGEGEGTVLSTN